MCTLSENMFSIGGNLHMTASKDTKYEPLELIMEAQEEVRRVYRSRQDDRFKCTAEHFKKFAFFYKYVSINIFKKITFSRD